MKPVTRLMTAILTAYLLAGCGSAPTNQSKAQSPSSQENVQGDARNRAKAHAVLGFEYYAQNQFGTALQEAKIALKEDSSYTPAHNLLALVYMRLGDNKSAEDAFQRALQLSPGDPDIANDYGVFLCQSKREQESLQYFAKALQNPLYPAPLVALANSAECAMTISDYKTAEVQLQRALSMAPGNLRALSLMSSLRYRQKNYVEARKYIIELHRNSEPTASSAFLAYRIARFTGNRDDEARYLGLMRKQFSNSDEYRRMLQGSLE